MAIANFVLYAAYLPKSYQVTKDDDTFSLTITQPLPKPGFFYASIALDVSLPCALLIIGILGLTGVMPPCSGLYGGFLGAAAALSVFECFAIFIYCHIKYVGIEIKNVDAPENLDNEDQPGA